MTASNTFWIPFLVLVAATLVFPRGYRTIPFTSVLCAGLLTHLQTRTYGEGSPIDRGLLLFIYALGLLTIFAAADAARGFITPTRSTRNQNAINLASLFSAGLITRLQMRGWEAWIGQGVLVLAYTAIILTAQFTIHERLTRT